MNERLLHRREKGMFERIQGDRELLKNITIDMLKFGGKLTPILHWHMVHKAEQEKDESIRVQYSDTMSVERYEESFDEFYQSSDKFLDAWIGSAGCQPWTEQLLEDMTSFLKRVDAMKLFDRMLKTPEIDWLCTDLHTVVDVNLLNSYLFTAEKEYLILEVGGGYGRLAEAVLNIFSGVKYVMLDAVPGSLMFSYLYLKEQFPDKKIGYYYNDDPFDMEQFDLYICPSWHFERLNQYRYDAAINLSSFQEMAQEHVDYYLDLFDRVLRQDGMLYLHNSRDYVFKGKWNYPEHWERLFMYNLPKSWTDHFPAEVFRKRESADGHAGRNAFVEAAYDYSLQKLKEAQAQNVAVVVDTQPQEQECTDEWKEQYLALMQEYQGVLNSKSWKITAPLRGLKKFLKGKTATEK